MALTLHVLTNLFPPFALGGYELLAQDVVRLLRRRGHHVSVLTTGVAEEGERRDEIARILRLARPFGADAGRDRGRHAFAAACNRIALRRELQQTGRPDAVLVMSLRRLGLAPLRVYGEAGVPAVVTVNDDWPVAYVARAARGLRGVLGRALDAASPGAHTWGDLSPRRVVYLSNAIRTLVRDAGAPLPLGTVCAQGVDLDAFVRRADRPVGAELQLLFVGRLHPSKAPDVAIAALASLRRRGVRAVLTMVGAPVTQAYGDELAALATELGVRDAVRVEGHVDRAALPAVYARADVLIYPLRGELEAQGLTYMEAMATGLPVVAFPTGGARELLDEADVVGRALSCDGDAFATAVVANVLDDGQRRALVDRAYRWLTSRASLERYVDVLEAALESAARDRTDAPHAHAGAAVLGG